jgi:outer membrane protein
MSLGDAIVIALTHQPTEAEAVANRSIAGERLNIVKSQYYPTLTPQFTYNYDYSYAPVPQFIYTPTGIQEVTIPTGILTQTKTGDAALAYRVLDMGTRDLNNLQARQNLRAADYAEMDTRRTIIANVAAAYFTVLRDNALVRVDQAQVAGAQSTLDVTTAQVEAGVSAKKDVLQARANLLNAQVTLLQAQNNARLAQTQLRSTLGTIAAGGPVPGDIPLADVSPPSEDAPITAKLPTTGPGSATTASSTDEDAIRAYTQVALRDRPDLAESEQGVAASHTGVRLQQVGAGLALTTDVGAGYQFIPYSGTDRQVNIAASYPLFDGGLTRAQVREAQANLHLSQAQLVALEQQIAVDVEQAYRDLTQARATLPAARAALDAAQVNFDAANEARREGVESLVDVITAQTALVQAQQNYIEAVYGYFGADAALASAVGQADRIGMTTPNATTAPSAAGIAAPAQGAAH